MTAAGNFSIILWTTNIAALADFIVSVAGAELEEQHPGYARLLAGSSELQLHADEAYRGHPWYDALVREGAARGIGSELRFLVEDVGRAHYTAMQYGARSITPPYEDNGFVECQVMGPDGYLFCFWSPAPRRRYSGAR